MEHFTRLTKNGWHHMRVLRFPAADDTTERGIGAHTDYGLLVIAAQDEVGGLFIRPPVPGEERGRNWLPGESMAGRFEHQEPWTFVKPVPEVFTVFPGDNIPLAPEQPQAQHDEPLDWIHYGSHFTDMFMRCYPKRSATARIQNQGGGRDP